MPNRDVRLTEHFNQFIEQQIATGRYQDASDVLSAGLRLLEQQTQAEEQHLSAWKRLVEDGFASLDEGRGLALEGDEALHDAIADIGRRVAERAARRSAG